MYEFTKLIIKTNNKMQKSKIYNKTISISIFKNK